MPRKLLIWTSLEMELLDMVKMNLISNRKGFTLLELMAVLVIMGVMASAGVKKYDRLSDTADITALKAGIRELNMQETLVWIQMKLFNHCRIKI